MEPPQAPQPDQPIYVSNYQMPGLNLYINPLFNGYMDTIMSMDGQIIRSINLESVPTGAKRKRPGYTTFLNSLGTQTNNLFSWNNSQANQIYVYNYTAGTLFYYDATAGTGTSWLPCGNGTFGVSNSGSNPGQYLGHAFMLGTSMICGDGVGSSRHTTDGTSFTNTTLAPVAAYWVTYQNAIYAGGGTQAVSPSVLFNSNASDATNWVISGTTSTSSLGIPDDGFINQLFVLAQNLFIGKTTGRLFRWDGYNLWDQSSLNGPISPFSYAAKEGVGFWLSTDGIMMSQGDTPSLISNAIQPQIYNHNNTGIAAGSFSTAPGVIHRYDYLLAVGSIQDDVSNEPMNNAVIKYNIQQNEFLNYQFNDNPTAWTTYKDYQSNYKLLFGGTAGQVFLYGGPNGTTTSDNGVSIPCVIDMVFNFNTPYLQKDWRWLWAFFNPGCQAQISIATSDTFDRGKKNWIDIGDASSGVVQYRFPQGLRSRLLWVRIKEESQSSRLDLLGISLQAIPKDPG